MASLTVENYVKTIFKICRETGNRLATTGRLATALNVSPGTVTSMLKALSDSGLATYTPYEGVQLTEAGSNLALEIVRRHRLIESFLAEVLGMDWDEVHEDAEQLEHSVSSRLIERIDEFLGRPQYDPHGDPIPQQDGQIPRKQAQPLAECPTGAMFELAQVIDQSEEFLRYLKTSGFSLGCRGRVVANRPEAGIMTLSIDDREVSLGVEAAQKVLVSQGSESRQALASESVERRSAAVPAPHTRATSRTSVR